MRRGVLSATAFYRPRRFIGHGVLSATAFCRSRRFAGHDALQVTTFGDYLTKQINLAASSRFGLSVRPCAHFSLARCGPRLGRSVLTGQPHDQTFKREIRWQRTRALKRSVRVVNRFKASH